MILLTLFCLKGPHFSPLFCQKGLHFAQKNPPVEVSGMQINKVHLEKYKPSFKLVPLEKMGDAYIIQLKIQYMHMSYML